MAIPTHFLFPTFWAFRGLLGPNVFQPWHLCERRVSLFYWLGRNQLWNSTSHMSRAVLRTWNFSSGHWNVQLRPQVDRIWLLNRYLRVISFSFSLSQVLTGLCLKVVLLKGLSVCLSWGVRVSPVFPRLVVYWIFIYNVLLCFLIVFSLSSVCARTSVCILYSPAVFHPFPRLLLLVLYRLFQIQISPNSNNPSFPTICYIFPLDVPSLKNTT